VSSLGQIAKEMRILGKRCIRMPLPSCDFAFALIFAKPLMDWQEPWFFVQRVQGRRGWYRRIGLMTIVAVVMMGGMYADRKWGRGPRFGLIPGSRSRTLKIMSQSSWAFRSRSLLLRFIHLPHRDADTLNLARNQAVAWNPPTFVVTFKNQTTCSRVHSKQPDVTDCRRVPRAPPLAWQDFYEDRLRVVGID
jgi:hypothetical protein